MPRRHALASAGWLLLVGACSFRVSCGDRTLDTAKGEQAIAAWLEQTLELPATVTCPRGVKLKAGDVVECQAQVNGVPVRVKVTQADDKGNVKMDLVEGYVLAARLEKVIAARLAEQLEVETTVQCGDRLRPSVPGATFSCTATSPQGETLDLAVTIKDGEDTVDFEIVRPPTPTPH